MRPASSSRCGTRATPTRRWTRSSHVDAAARTRDRAAARAFRTGSRPSARSRCAATTTSTFARSRTRSCCARGRSFRYIDLAESQRNLYESNLFRLALFSVAAAAGQRQEHQHRRARDEDARGARRRAASTTSTSSRSTGATRTTTVRRRPAARRHRRGRQPRRDAAGRPRLLPRAPRTTFFGQRRRFSLPTWQVSADVKQPAWLRKPENALSVGGFAHRRARRRCTSIAATAGSSRSRARWRRARPRAWRTGSRSRASKRATCTSA